MAGSEPFPLAPTAKDSGDVPLQRRRAPRRTGRRTQLTVPEDMWDQVAGIARTAGTTPNDMLVHLVAERLRDRRRALALRKRADERWRAFTEIAPAAPLTMEPISEEELVGLSEAFRADAEV